MNKEKSQRFTVARAKIPQKDGVMECNLVLDNGIPAININKALLPKDKEYPRPESTRRYHICKFLNYLDSYDIEYEDATMEQIATFLQHIYIGENVSYNTLVKYINVIGNLYEFLALIGRPLDPSLYIPWPGTEPKAIKDKRLVPQTKIYYLKHDFKPRKADAWLKYTKWYTREQYQAIAEQLPLVHRIIFLITVFLGYRCSSALSVKLSMLNLRTKEIKPSHTKTGQNHISLMPNELVLLIESYIENERSFNPGCGSDWLFLNNRGEQMSYHSYYSALKRAAEKVRELHSELELGPVHTHAGRSTFAAALRTYQLREQRLGHKTFSDSDFCMLMDWASLQNLKYYDKATRLQETATIHEAFFEDFDNILGDALDEIYRDQKA